MIHRENPDVFLVFGTGYIGQEVEALLKAKGENYHITRCRLENREEVAQILDEIKPTHVINTAGARGAPNADWCEDHKEDTLRANVAGAINLVDLCNLRGIHVTHFGSGCIYGADDEHPLDGPGYKESDTPNFFGSFYGYSKIVSEMALKHFPNVLVLRIRFAIAANLAEKNHVTKILGYKRLVDVPSSGSMLPNLLPGALLMAKHGDTGVYNFTNPGVLGNNQIMSMFKDMIRPSLTWENFTVADQNKVLKSQRSTCALDSTKLVNKLKEYGYEVLDAETALRQVYQMMKDTGYE